MIERLFYDWRLDLEYKDGAGFLLLHKTDEALRFLERAPQTYVDDAVKSAEDWVRAIIRSDFNGVSDKEGLFIVRTAMLERKRVPEDLATCFRTVENDIFEEVMHLRMGIETSDDESWWHNLNIHTRAGYLRVIARYTSYLMEKK
jgi:hypothetical protein